MSSWAGRLFVAASGAAGLSFLLFAALPDDLDVRTDIVGYPTFANFSIDRYFWAYGLTVVFFPLATFGLYLLLERAFAGPQGPRAPIPPHAERVEAVPVASGRRAVLVSLARSLFVGGVLGLEASVVAGRDGGAWWVFVLTMLGYCAVVGLAAAVARSRRREPIDVASWINTLAAPLTVAGLYGVSESTEVRVATTGAVHEYPWLPAWLAFGVAAALLVWLARKLTRAGTNLALRALERQALLLVAAPVALFLSVSALPGDLGTVNFFEEGQALSGSEQTRDGAFPWRDLLFPHGLLHDVTAGLIGTEVVEDSFWGFRAAETLLLEPLGWIGLYYLCTYLFGANWLFLLGTQLLVVTEHVFAVQFRFVLVPFILLLLAALLRRPTVARAAGFTTLLVLQMIVTPEALVVGAAVLGTLILFELYYGRGLGFVARFRRTWLCFATGAALLAIWSGFLLAFGALDDWIFTMRAILPGHRLTGGLRSFVSASEFEAVVQIVLVLTAAAFFVATTRLRRRLALQDWVMFAAAGLTLLYYAKFLSRANHYHLYQSFSVAVPLLFYAAYRGITFVEAGLAEFARARGLSGVPARHTLTVPLLVVLLATAPIPPADTIRDLPARFSSVVSEEPEIQRLGYDTEGDNDIRMIRDVSRTMSSLVEPGEAIFDFSNTPGLFHYILDLPPSTRYYHVSFAVRRRQQTDLVRLLDEERPELVVYTSDDVGFPIWDGIANQVRYYDVSEYLLDHYVPVLDSHGFVLMTRRDAGDAVPQLYFHVDPCDWGFVPNFFTPEPAPSAESVSLPHRVREAGQRLEVTLPADAAAYGWLELRTGRPLAEGRFELSDRPGGDARRSIAFETLDRGETSVRVKVGACSQWRGYRPGTLSLTSSVPQDVAEIRLVR